MSDAFPRSHWTCPKRELQRLLGELRITVLAIPDSTEYLSWIQHQVKQAGERILLTTSTTPWMTSVGSPKRRWRAPDLPRRGGTGGTTLQRHSEAAGLGMGGV